MKTAKEREKEFRDRLEELFAEFEAEYSITDDGKPYGFHQPVFNISMYAKYNPNGDCVAEFTSFNL